MRGLFGSAAQPLSERLRQPPTAALHPLGPEAGPLGHLGIARPVPVGHDDTPVPLRERVEPRREGVLDAQPLRPLVVRGGGVPRGEVVGLAVVCSAAAFLIFFALIREVGPLRATVITYVNPAVAAVLGVTLLDERLTAGMVIGFSLVLVGSVLATGGTPEAVAEP